jgi:hypothetical protein
MPPWRASSRTRLWRRHKNSAAPVASTKGSISLISELFDGAGSTEPVWITPLPFALFGTTQFRNSAESLTILIHLPLSRSDLRWVSALDQLVFPRPGRGNGQRKATKKWVRDNGLREGTPPWCGWSLRLRPACARRRRKVSVARSGGVLQGLGLLVSVALALRRIRRCG